MATRKHVHVLVPLTLAILLALPASAAPGGRGPAPGPFGPPGDHGPHGPGLMRILERLDLTDEQREQVQGILERHRETNVGLYERMREARRAVGERIHAPELDEAAIRAAVADLGLVEADLAVSRARVLTAVRAVLTPEQQATLEELHERREEFFDEHPWAMRGPGRRPYGPGGARR